MKIPGRTLVLLAMLFGLAIRSAAQSTPLATIATVAAGDVYLYDLDGSGTAITSDAMAYRWLSWSADGQLLAFTGVSDPNSTTAALYVAGLTGTAPLKVVDDVHARLPVSFDPGGGAGAHTLVYGQLANNTQASAQLIRVQTFALAAGAAPTFIGEYTWDDSCASGINPLLPNESRRFDELDQRETGRALLVMMPFGVLYNTSCQRDRFNVMLMNPRNGQSVELFERADQVFVSPEQTRAIVKRANSLIFVNTERGPYTEITTLDAPDQVGFGQVGSGEIFYTTRTRIGDTALPTSIAETLLSRFGTPPGDYQVDLHRYSLQTGADTVIYSTDAYSINRLQLTADGSTLLFSQVDNPAQLINAYANGTLTPGSGGFALVTPTLYQLALADNSVTMLGRDRVRFALNPAG